MDVPGIFASSRRLFGSDFAHGGRIFLVEKHSREDPNPTNNSSAVEEGSVRSHSF